jgi:subtilisin family serine protease
MVFPPSVSLLPESSNMNSRGPKRSRRLSVEALENRMLMAADFAPGELLLQVQEGHESDVQQHLLMRGGRSIEMIRTEAMKSAGSPSLMRIAMPSGTDVLQAATAMTKIPGVVSADPNWWVKPSFNDPFYASGNRLWGTYSDDLGSSVGPPGTTNPFGSGAERAWAASIWGNSNVVIGVIDEGIQVTHPDLLPNIWVNPNEIAGDGLDNDGNGYVDDVNGFDFYNNDGSVYDGTADDHGTHVAGTIGARGGNGIGVAGVAWNVKMISAKFLGPSGGYTSDAVRALDYLTALKNSGVNIVATNNSWGGGGYSSSLHAAIIRSANAGILFVAAAGNAASNNDSTANYPSNYSTLVSASGQPAASYESVIAVAAIDSNGAMASFSNFGATQVDIGAPGVAINSTLPGSTYGAYSGTSMATPHVAGGVALIASARPTMTPKDIRDALLTTAKPTLSLTGRTVTGGRLDLAAALNVTPPLILSISGGSVQEGNIGARALPFNVSLNSVAAVPITVSFATGGGTATAGTDYLAQSGSVTFSPGETLKTIPVGVIGDTLVEPNETFTMILSNVVSSVPVSFGTSSAVGTIVNDDILGISVFPVTGSENAGTFWFRLGLTEPAATPITVRFNTSNGTARSGSRADYLATSGTIRIEPGVQNILVGVPIVNDVIRESTEFFYVNLSSPVNVIIQTAQATGTIIDDDGVGSVTPQSQALIRDSLLADPFWVDSLQDSALRRRIRR